MRAIRCQCAHCATAFWVAVAAVLLLGLVACRRGAPVIDTGPKPMQVDGTVSGTVRGPEGTSPIAGRAVEVVNVATGERQHVVTNSAGGYTFKVKPGKYRVELTLNEGERLIKSPGELDVKPSDVDAGADFVIGTSTIARPRYHAPRADDGLGAAIA